MLNHDQIQELPTSELEETFPNKIALDEFINRDISLISASIKFDCLDCVMFSRPCYIHSFKEN